ALATRKRKGRPPTTLPVMPRLPTPRSRTTLLLRATPARTDPLEGEDDLAEQVAGDHGLEAVARLGQRQHPVDDRAGPGLLEEPGQPPELIAGPHGRAGHRQLGEEHPGEFGRRGVAAGRAANHDPSAGPERAHRMRPGGL